MPNHHLFAMKFAKVYPLYVQKAERKHRTKEEVDQIICWLTGYDQAGLQKQIDRENDLETFFAQAPGIHPNSVLIKGVVCGVRVEEIQDPLMQKVRYLDKMIDELAKGKTMEKILRIPDGDAMPAANKRARKRRTILAADEVAAGLAGKVLVLALLLISLSSLMAPAYAQQSEGSSVSLTVPKAPWALFISGEALVLTRQEIKPDGSQGYFMLVDEKAQIFASLFIEPADKCKTSKECRDFVWKLGNPSWKNPQNVKLSEMGEISILELLVPEFQGKPVRQHNLYAEFVVDGYWVDLHLSKVLYRDQDRVLFERMVKSVRFEHKKADVADERRAQSGPDKRIEGETMQFVAQASDAYLKQDYKKAIQLYGKALDLEREHPTLDKNLWRVVVDNLGISYGISGDSKKAKEVFEYGLSKDATYPMFYYNLACAHAEMNDLDNAIKNLRLAFSYKANMIPGEQIPDPAGDASFARFLSNPRFRKLLEEIR